MSHLPARVSSVPAARALAAAVCARWRIPTEAVQRVQVIITELTTNVVLHACTTMTLVFRRVQRVLSVAVYDGSTQPAQMRDPKASAAPGGRGLILVNAYAIAWGCQPTRRGKRTWAAIHY